MKQPLMVVILAVFWVLAVGLTVQDWNDVYLLTPVQIVRYRPDLITDGTVIELERPPAKSEKYQRYIANRGEHRKEYWRERYKGQTEKKWAKYLTVGENNT